jgi:hypothetical protein
MSDHQPESPGERPVPPPPGQGFPPPPQYPGYQTGPVPPQSPGPQTGPVPPQYPGYQTGPVPPQSPGPQTGPVPPRYPGYQTGPVPPQYPGPQTGPVPPQWNQPYPTQPVPPNAGLGYPPGPGAQYGPHQTEYLAAGPGIPPGPPPAGPRPRRRGLWVAVGAATVVAVGGASVAAYAFLSGGGTTLDKSVPADTIAYAEVNLDPPAGQKVAALRYLKHFPSLKVDEKANSLLDALFEEIFPNAEDRQKFVKDVQPWLGKHVAVAADPQGDKPQPVVVAEVSDANKARSGLADLAKEQDFGYVVGDGIVTIAETQVIATRAATDAGKSSLSGNSTYRDDVKSVGGNGGVITAWANFADAAKYIPRASGNDVNLDALKGTRIALSLRFTDNVADLTVKTLGGTQPKAATGVGERVGRLPDDTVAAVGISGGDQLVRQAYDALRKAGLASELEAAVRDYDLRLPDDVANLVGSQTVLAVAGDAHNPSYGVVTKTADPARAKQVAERLLAQVDSSVTVVQQQTGDGLVLASSQAYLTKLASGQGGLGNTDRFRKAVPDAGSSQFVIYVDVQRLIALSDAGDVPADVRPIQSVGISASSQGGSSTVHVRVVVG